MQTISLKNIRKRYDGNEEDTVKDFSLDIAEGEFVVFVGPSGCGKSTTLRMIAGLEDITGGTLEIGGRVVNDVHPKDRGIAMVFQNYALYPFLNVYDNIGFGLKIRKVNRHERDRRIREAAEMLGLQYYLKRKPSELSGGQRQRVALGRAIVNDANIFLMDEPLSNLDAKLRVQMREEIIRLRKELNATMIYVTHDQVEAMTMADRIVIMKDGDIMQVGSPEDVYLNPQNLFVAGFIGSPPMNFMPVTVAGQDLLLDEQVVASHRDFAPFDGRELILGIRPEDITLDRDGLRSLVSLVELLGADYHVHADCFGHALVLRLPVDKHRLQDGELLRLAFPADKIYLFDKDSEQLVHGGQR